MDSAQIVIVSALVIGLIYGSVGLLSGFCMMSSLRGWWAEGDGRLVRTYALAIGIAFFLLQRLIESGTTVFNLDPVVLAWLPTALLATVTLLLLARAR